MTVRTCARAEDIIYGKEGRPGGPLEAGSVSGLSTCSGML